MDSPGHPTDTHRDSSFNIAGLSVPESFVKIDKEISRLESQLRFFRSLRNTLPHINKLPNEILSKIFLGCRGTDPDRNVEPKFGLTRLRISWVSRRWRTVALSDPVLWSIIASAFRFFPDDRRDHTIEVDYFHACVERSGGLDLSVCLHTSTTLHELSIRHLHRIREIDIDLRSTNLRYQNWWSTPAPKLVSLSICCQYFRDEADTRGLRIFGGIFPNLRHLSLRECTFGADFPLIWAPGLTTLHVDSPTELLSLGVFVQRLRSMEALEDLRLVRCFEIEDDSTSVDAHIKLPKLQTLAIGGAMCGTLGFLGVLDLSLVSLDVFVNADAYTEAGLRTHLEFLRDQCNKLHFWGEEGVNNLSVELAASQVIITASRAVPPFKTHLLEVTYNCWTGSIVCDLTLCVYESLPLENLQDVSLTGVSRRAIYVLNKLCSPDVLKLQSVADDVDELDVNLLATLGLFSCVKQLEVDGTIYSSFREFQDS